MVRRSSFEPLLFSLVETLYHITSGVLPSLNITRYPFAIHSKRIGRYPLVSVDQVRFCGELLLFFPLLFFFFFLFLPWDGFSPWKSPLFTYHSFFSSLLFPLFYTSFFPLLFLSYSNIFLPLSPCLLSLFILFPFLNLSMFFFFPSTSVNIHHNSSITDECH